MKARLFHLIVMSILLIACQNPSSPIDEEEPPQIEIAISAGDFDMDLYGDTSETLITNADSYTDITLSWSSDNENVVTVSDGIISAIGIGTAVISVTASGEGYEEGTDSIQVTVINSFDYSPVTYYTPPIDQSSTNDGLVYEWLIVHYSKNEGTLDFDNGVKLPDPPNGPGLIPADTQDADNITILNTTEIEPGLIEHEIEHRGTQYTATVDLRVQNQLTVHIPNCVIAWTNQFPDSFNTPVTFTEIEDPATQY